MRPKEAVRRAIAEYQPLPGFKLFPPSRSESSVIFDWGVRVEFIDGNKAYPAWICLADDECRRACTIYVLSAGKTSKATLHLRNSHDITSEKTSVEQDAKRKRDDELEHFLNSTMYKNNPRRFALLMETRRIINHNLPFCHGEYAESLIIEELLKKDAVKTTPNAERVTRSIIELYASTKDEIISVLDSSKLIRRTKPNGIGNFTMMADFWTCKVTHSKYLGIRVYFVDTQFRYRSVLLGTRKFNPAFGDRFDGIQKPFHAWILQILEDFELTTGDFFAAMTDGGSDVKKMALSTLKLKWEWCVAHMAHAATRVACGMNDSATSVNPGLTKLISNMSTTIYQVQMVEKSGDLFAALCRSHSDGASTQLLHYSSQRFLSATTSMRRILQKWDALVEWYKARIDQAKKQKTKPPAPFLLENDKTTLIQLLSMLEPISSIKRIVQAEAPIQVEVLISLYDARLTTLKVDEPLEDYRSTDENPLWIPVTELTPLAAETRRLLCEAFDSRFFSRYTTPSGREDCSLIFEMQQRLHPTFKAPEKSLNKIIRVCMRDKKWSAAEEASIKESAERSNVSIPQMKARHANDIVKSINLSIHNTIRDLAIGLVDESVFVYSDEEETKESEPTGRMGRMARNYGAVSNSPTTGNRAASQAAAQVDEELRRWMEGQQALHTVPPKTPGGRGRPESVLEFWRRMHLTSEFRVLPKLARLLFAVPASSAQIERDFSVCGDMVTAQRTRLSQTNIDMCSFLNRNQDLVDVTQCEEIPVASLTEHIPPNVTFPIDGLLYVPDDIVDGMIVDLMSMSADAASFSEPLAM